MPFFFRSEKSLREAHIQRLGEITRPARVHPTPATSHDTHDQVDNGVRLLATTVPVFVPSRKTASLVTVIKDPSLSAVVNSETLGAVSSLEGQWSPSNPERRKRYDRDFLLQLQTSPLSLRKPSNLPNLDIIKDKARIQRMPPIVKPRVKIDDQVLNEHQEPQTAVGKRKKSKKEKSGIPVLPNKTIKLHKSETPWMPSHKVKRASGKDSGEQDLFKKIRGILNKLTLQNFETLVEQMKELPIDSMRKLVGTVILVFERAIIEPYFNAVYASMCKQLALVKVPLNEEQDYMNINFGEHLTIMCQRELQQDKNIEKRCEETVKAIKAAKTDEEKCKELQKEFDEEVKKIRMRKFGIIRFMGELFKLDMIPEPTMLECIRNLLGQSHDDEESFDCLCQLLKDISTELGRRGKQEFINLCIFWMQRIVDKHLTSLKLRFMLQDVIDLLKNVWIDGSSTHMC